MKVLFVTNNVNVPGNGICSSVNATVKHLKDRGIDARLLAGKAMIRTISKAAAKPR